MSERGQQASPAQRPLVRGVFVDGWLPISVAFALYCLFYAYGGLNEIRWPNFVGAGFLFGVLAFLPKRDRALTAPFFAAFLLLAIPPMVSFLGFPVLFDAFSYFKYCGIFLLYLLLQPLKLVPLERSKSRYLFSACILFFMVLSLVTGRMYSVAGDRLEGIFQSPNTLLLVVFSLLFFVDEERDPKVLVGGVHVLIVVFCFLTSTLGGILGYGACLAFKYKDKLFSRRGALRRLILLTMGVTLVALLLPRIETTHAFQRVSLAFQATTQNLPEAYSGRVDFGTLAPEYGGQNLSGVWRIMHWRQIWDAYVGSTPVNWLFGLGLNYSQEVFGKTPHNDYLRILAEQGWVGLVLYAVFFVSLYRKVPAGRRYPTIAFFVYSLTDNNLDSFIYMALLVFFFHGYENGEERPALEGRPAGTPAGGGPS